MENVEYIAGGATLNTMRVAQWCLGDKAQTGYIGSIGQDKFGQLLQDKCKEAGIQASFMVDPKDPTGTCAIGILNKERGMVANLASANNYKVDHFKKEENLAMAK